MRRGKSMEGYEPLTWDAESLLGPQEQETIEHQRRDLWRAGIREPTLTRMAFEFGAVITMLRGAKSDGDPALDGEGESDG
jgi:hypothetical protein